MISKVKMAAGEQLRFHVSIALDPTVPSGPSETPGIELQGYSGSFGAVSTEERAVLEPGQEGAIGTVRIFDAARPNLGYVDVEIELAAGEPSELEVGLNANAVLMS
jgi:hypothetical protein